MDTSKMVRSLGLGNSMFATLPPSSSAMSLMGEGCVREMSGEKKELSCK